VTPPGAADQGFWGALDALLAELPIVVDRPRGTSHPLFPDTVYPRDYGYLDGTRSNDGAAVDVFIGGRADRTVDGYVATVDPVKRDVELKLLVGCDDHDIAVVADLLRGMGMCPLITPRPPSA